MTERKAIKIDCVWLVTWFCQSARCWLCMLWPEHTWTWTPKAAFSVNVMAHCDMSQVSCPNSSSQLKHIYQPEWFLQVGLKRFGWLGLTGMFSSACFAAVKKAICAVARKFATQFGSTLSHQDSLCPPALWRKWPMRLLKDLRWIHLFNPGGVLFMAQGWKGVVTLASLMSGS